MILNLAANDFLRLSRARGTTVGRMLWDRAMVLVTNYASGLQERRTVRELERLSDHTLRDIGLTRDEIESAARGRGAL